MRIARSLSLMIIVFIVLGTSAWPGKAGQGFREQVHVLWAVTGGQPGALFGWAVSELEDIDGDGVEEAMTSAVLDGPNANGAVFVFSGATGDPLYEFNGAPGDLLGYAIADAGDVDADGAHDIVAGARNGNRALVFSGATGDQLLELTGDQPGDFFGFAVASAGDVDADAHADLLVGATQDDASGLNSGRVYVFSGIDGSLIRTLEAEGAGDLFGSGTDGTEDIDGDGIDDHVVGARNAGRFEDGKVYAFSGATGERIWSADAQKSGEDLGWFFVAGVGDLDSDGTPDVYGGDFTSSAEGDDRGRVFVFSGEDGSVLLDLSGTSAKQGFGPGREAGDVDGDGTPDLVVGSYLSSDGAWRAGKAEVFSGADGSLIRRITGTTRGENFGFDAVGLGEVDGDGTPDLLVSAAEGDVVYVISGDR
jgi:hypothetical protein